MSAGQPRELGLLELLQLFIEHRIDVVRRRTQYELRKAHEREHILLGYHIALDYIDDVIKIIRGSSSRANARENLHEFFENKSVRVLVGGKETTIKGVKLDARNTASRFRSIGRRSWPQLHPDRRHPRIAAAPPHAALRR